MNNEFTPAVTISMKEYERLRRLDGDKARLTEIRDLLESIVRFDWMRSNRDSFNLILDEIRHITNRNIWEDNK